MGRIVRRTAFSTIVSIIGTLTLCYVASFFLGGLSFGWWCMAGFCPLAMAAPVSFYICRQNEQLRVANAALQNARGKLAEALKKQSEYGRLDHMTGLLNRETFYRELEFRRRRSDLGWILLIDADEFKSVNDSYGHEAGDLALRAIAGAIARNVRNGDVVGRVGGEEFAVMLATAGRADAARIAERIRLDVHGLTFEPAPSRRLSVSIGGAEVSDSVAPQEALRIADRNLYAAKHTGRNRIVMSKMAETAA